jgi:hypothetical protein
MTLPARKMSALGQKRTCAVHYRMSALGQKRTFVGAALLALTPRNLSEKDGPSNGLFA